jgi:hypothetical protein
MTTKFGSNITVDGSLNAAVDAAPTLPNNFTMKLPVPWSPEKYEAAIVHHLRTLQTSTVGKAVLSQLVKPLTIRPYIWTPPNALTVGLEGEHATELGKPVTPGSTVRGTGQGTSVTIWITLANRKVPDASLLHESVHAVRAMHGARAAFAYPAKFNTEEEYFAILIANIYQSEKKRKLMKIDHTGNSWIDATSPWDQFRVDPYLITIFGMRHSGLALDIGRAKAEFNPFSPQFSEKVRVH